MGWVGAVLAYLAVGLAAVNASDDLTVRGLWIALDLIGWYAIVPLATATLVTGIGIAIGTKWGLFRHYWVIISLILTVIAFAVLLIHMPDVTTTAEFARTASGAELAALGGDLAHPAIGLVVLLVVQTLNIYKPRGTTHYGSGR